MQVSEFNALVQKYCDFVDFVTIYVMEAHPSDSLWPDNDDFDVKVSFIRKYTTEYEHGIHARTSLFLSPLQSCQISFAVIKILSSNVAQTLAKGLRPSKLLYQIG